MITDVPTVDADPTDWSRHQAYFVCPAIGQSGWTAATNVRLPAGDLGFRQGVTAVERIRTRGGRPFLLRPYLDRFAATTRYLEIDGLPKASELKTRIFQCLDHNAKLWQIEGDVGITLWATPGIGSGSGFGSGLGSGSGNRATEPKPTWAITLHRLDGPEIARRIADGQPVVITDVQQPVDASWSRQIKVRCRLHYYRADRIAQKVDARATGMLVDEAGFVTESSIANFALVSGRTIVSPPSDAVLPGVTQRHVESIAHERGIRWDHRPIGVDEFHSADGILLMGTDTGLWFANRVHPGTFCRGDNAIIRELQKFFFALP